MKRTLHACLVVVLTTGAASAQDVTPDPAIELNAARAELGKRMFYDARLSGDTSLACASRSRATAP